MGEGVNYPNLDFPSVIDITLYKNNYYDNLLVTKLKNNTRYKSIDDIKDTYLVNADEFKSVMYTFFMKEIEAARSLPLSDLQRNAISVYFLDKIFTSYLNITNVKINVSKEENYSRINRTEKQPVIFFNYKISVLDIKLPEIFNKSELRCINSFLIENELAVYDEFLGYDHRIYIKTDELMGLALSINDEASTLILAIIDNKSEMDNPLIMLSTDFDI
jgi:hypothetical protein